MQLQQQEKPLKQQLRTTIWQNGKPSIETSLEKLPETLNDPQALVWLEHFSCIAYLMHLQIVISHFWIL